MTKTLKYSTASHALEKRVTAAIEMNCGSTFDGSDVKLRPESFFALFFFDGKLKLDYVPTDSSHGASLFKA